MRLSSAFLPATRISEACFNQSIDLAISKCFRPRRPTFNHHRHAFWLPSKYLSFLPFSSSLHPFSPAPSLSYNFPSTPEATPTASTPTAYSHPHRTSPPPFSPLPPPTLHFSPSTTPARFHWPPFPNEKRRHSDINALCRAAGKLAYTTQT